VVKDVLLVDDEPLMLRIVQRRLRSIGRNVVVARSSREALRELEQQHFDLAIVDYYLRDERVVMSLRERVPGLRIASSQSIVDSSEYER
jgi:CheY-like chemotaxis protein